MPAPVQAIEYYSLPPEAKFRDMIMAIRADEACHREVNHHFVDLPSYASIEHQKVTL